VEESLTPQKGRRAGSRVGGPGADRFQRADGGARGRIVVVGLPNTGKSQLFGELTGEYTLVANYPLTTIEVTRGHTRLSGARFEVLDTPGLHSLYIHSEEEVVVRSLLLDEPPDALIQCIDAGRLGQSLPLTLDLLELELPLIVVLNAVDETEAQGIQVNAVALADRLGLPVIEHVAGRRRDVERLKTALAQLLGPARLAQPRCKPPTGRSSRSASPRSPPCFPSARPSRASRARRAFSCWTRMP
jgi:small GTP-binding protein